MSVYQSLEADELPAMTFPSVMIAMIVNEKSVPIPAERKTVSLEHVEAPLP